MAKSASAPATTTDTTTNLNNLTAQVGDVNTVLGTVQTSLSNQKVLEWISLALAILGLGSAAIFILKRKK